MADKSMTRRTLFKKSLKAGGIVTSFAVSTSFWFDSLNQGLRSIYNKFINRKNSDPLKSLLNSAAKLPHVNPWFDREEYASAIRTGMAKYGYDIDKDFNVAKLIVALTAHESGFRTNNLWAMGLAFISEGSYDRTTGSMENNALIYAEDKGISTAEAQKKLKTIEGTNNVALEYDKNCVQYAMCHVGDEIFKNNFYGWKQWI